MLTTNSRPDGYPAYYQSKVPTIDGGYSQSRLGYSPAGITLSLTTSTKLAITTPPITNAMLSMMPFNCMPTAGMVSSPFAMVGNARAATVMATLDDDLGATFGHHREQPVTARKMIGRRSRHHAFDRPGHGVPDSDTAQHLCRTGEQQSGGH